MSQPPAETLSAADSTRLIEFARACKAAARVVTLYPGGHPSIATTLGRLVQLTAADQLSSPLRLNVLADDILMDGRAIGRIDPAVTELASLLHGHMVGDLTIHAGGDVEAWRSFLLLLGRPFEDVRVEQVTALADSSIKREPGMGMRLRTGTIKIVRMPVMALLPVGDSAL